MTIADWLGVCTFAVAIVGVVLRLLAPLKLASSRCAGRGSAPSSRYRLEAFVTAAIIGTLPREQRIDLLAQIDERIRPSGQAA